MLFSPFIISPANNILNILQSLYDCHTHAHSNTVTLINKLSQKMWFSTRLNLEDIQGISDKDPKLITVLVY